MAQKNDITRELRTQVERFISRTLKDLSVELKNEFDRNFEREAFFNQRWARRKWNDDESRGLLAGTGTLRRSIRAETTPQSVVFSSDTPYAAIHNEGGTITVTRRMKGYFWRKYLLATGGTGGGRTPRNAEPSTEALFYKRMALKKVGSKIVIPCRRFIGLHPEVERIIREVTED